MTEPTTSAIDSPDVRADGFELIIADRKSQIVRTEAPMYWPNTAPRAR